MIAELAALWPLLWPLASEAGEHAEVPAPFYLIIWTALTFTLVLIVLWRFAWGPIQEQLERRENTIRDAIEGAERERSEAESARKKREQELENVEAEGQQLLNEARDDAKKLRDEGREAGERARKDQVEAASRDIDAARVEALGEVKTAAAELAMTIASRVVGKSIDAKDHQRLIDESIAGIEASR